MNEVKSIKISDLISAPNNPFKVTLDVEMERLIESIAETGIIAPIIVRPTKNGKYEIVSGHRRKYACEYLGIESIPTIVKELDRNEAVIFLVDSNLQIHCHPLSKQLAFYTLHYPFLHKKQVFLCFQVLKVPKHPQPEPKLP